MFEGKILRKRLITSPYLVDKLVKLIDEYGLEVIKVGYGSTYKTINQWKTVNKYRGLNSQIIFDLKLSTLEITTKFLEGKPCTYIFDLNLDEEFVISGHSCFAEFQKWYKVPNVEEYNLPFMPKYFDKEKGKYICSAKPVINYNKKYNQQTIVDCYEYDLNSAYSSVLIKKIPDVQNGPLDTHIVGKNQIGFNVASDNLFTVTSGEADVVFNLIDSPQKIKDYCFKYYNLKSHSKTKLEKETNKARLNLPIGYTQRWNPFFRAYVVNECNKIIKPLIDKDTLLWNTDAIISKVKRTDLDIGDEIGQWKEIPIKTLKYSGNTYQIDNEIPVQRGIPKQWFKRFEQVMGRPFDLLTDTLPSRGNNIYEFNFETMRLEKNYEKEIN